MKFHTIKSERFNTRENGKYASYPIYEHSKGKRVGILECYSDDVNMFLSHANRVEHIEDKPFWKDKEE